MEGHSVISPDVLARYAADAAREVRGVHGLVGRNDGVKVVRDDDRVAVELHLALDWGANAGMTKFSYYLPSPLAILRS